MKTTENAADTPGGVPPIPPPLETALKKIHTAANRAQLRADRNPYAMGARDALDQALHDLHTALQATYGHNTGDSEQWPP